MVTSINKRMVSILLSFSMIFSLVSVPTYARETDDYISEVKEQFENMVNDNADEMDISEYLTEDSNADEAARYLPKEMPDYDHWNGGFLWTNGSKGAVWLTFYTVNGTFPDTHVEYYGFVVPVRNKRKGIQLDINKKAIENSNKEMLNTANANIPIPSSVRNVNAVGSPIMNFGSNFMYSHSNMVFEGTSYIENVWAFVDPSNGMVNVATVIYNGSPVDLYYSTGHIRLVNNNGVTIVDQDVSFNQTIPQGSNRMFWFACASNQTSADVWNAGIQSQATVYWQ